MKTENCSGVARCVCATALMMLILADYAACCYFSERIGWIAFYPAIGQAAAQITVFGGGLFLAGMLLLAAAKIMPSAKNDR